MKDDSFLLVVITSPGPVPGEAGLLEDLLAAGLRRLHLRKPGGSVEGLLERLAPQWGQRLVVHGSEALARKYGVSQVHEAVTVGAARGEGGGAARGEGGGAARGEGGGGAVTGGGRGGTAMGEGGGAAAGGRGPGRMRRSTSVHSWEELQRLPAGLEYAFISPVFDSISKPDYRAVKGLVEMPTAGTLPCPAVALGGIDEYHIGRLLERGWKGAALLGWIWEEPRNAVRRWEQLNKIIDGQAKCAGDSGV